MGCINDKEEAKTRKKGLKEEADHEYINVLTQTERISTDFIFHHLDPLSSNSYSQLAQRSYISKGVSKMNSQIRIIKIFDCSTIPYVKKEELTNSITKLTQLKHLNVQATQKYYYHDNRLYLVGEYYEGGNLLNQLDKFSQLTQHAMLNIFCQIMAGLQYLHDQDVVHGDLRLEHIMFTNKTMEKIKLIDFGISNELKTLCNKWKSNNTISEFSFHSPETLRGSVTAKSDIWACGCLLYFFLTSHMPFQGKNIKSLQNEIKRGVANFDATEWVNINPQLKELVSKMLSPNPKSRPSASQILNHPALLNRYNIISKPNKQLQKHMQEFKINSQLQTAVLIYIAENMMSDSDKNKLMEEFGKFDLNKDGFLTKEELVQAYSLTMPKEKAMQQVKYIFKKVDLNNSGKIDYQEFILATIDQKKYFNKEKLLLLFQQVDRDHSGQLSKEEVKKMLRDMQIPKHKYDQLSNELDGNGDGQITQDEFVTMMLNM